jgi:hypothetical protein
MSNKLANYTIYNNWEKLDEEIGLLNEKNFGGLVEKSVKYHSKECFDILIQHTKARDWINEYPRKLTGIFENYVNAPNNHNEYYVNKILPLIAVLNFKSMNEIIKHPHLFSKIFIILKTDEKTIKYLMIQVINSNSIECFKFMFNYIKSNPQTFPFFNNNWINSNILFSCLEQDNLEILKELEKDGQNLSVVNIGFTPVSSLIISLLNRNLNCRYIKGYNRNIPKNNFKCFEYLLSKNINTEHNLVWSAIIEIDPIDSYYNDYFHLNVDWAFDFDRFPKDDSNITQQVHSIITSENLSAKLSEEHEYPEVQLWRQIINNIYYLVKSVKSLPQVQNYLTKINNIPNLDIIQKIFTHIFMLVNDLETTIKPTNRYLYMRTAWKKRQNKIRGQTILKALEIVRYFKEHNLTNFNSLNMVSNYVQTKNKSILKQIVIYLMKLGYETLEDFKTNVVPKVFTKKEIFDLDKTIEKSKLDDILKLIKKKVLDIKLQKRKNPVVIVPGIGGENEANELVGSDNDDSDNEINI